MVSCLVKCISGTSIAVLFTRIVHELERTQFILSLNTDEFIYIGRIIDNK